MQITQVKVFPVHEEKLKAFVSIVLDHCFMVNDIKVIQGKDGLFLSMPSRRKKNGEFKDVAHPLNNDTRRLLEEHVLGEYRRLVDDPTPRRPDRADAPAPTAAPTPAPAAGDEGEGAVREPEIPPLAASPASPAPRPTAVPEPVAAPAAADAASGEQTLEEVQEMHLRDSFWTVT